MRELTEEQLTPSKKVSCSFESEVTAYSGVGLPVEFVWWVWGKQSAFEFATRWETRQISPSEAESNPSSSTATSVPRCHISTVKSLQGWGVPPLVCLCFVNPCCDVSVVSCDLPQLISGALIMVELECKSPKFICLWFCYTVIYYRLSLFTESGGAGGVVLLLDSVSDAVVLKNLLHLDSWQELGAVHCTAVFWLGKILRIVVFQGFKLKNNLHVWRQTNCKQMWGFFPPRKASLYSNMTWQHLNRWMKTKTESVLVSSLKPWAAVAHWTPALPLCRRRVRCTGLGQSCVNVQFLAVCLRMAKQDFCG